jgi:hypothetical protein
MSNEDKRKRFKHYFKKKDLELNMVQKKTEKTQKKQNNVAQKNVQAKPRPILPRYVG